MAKKVTNDYIDSIIKANHTYNPNLNKTQGEKLRELIKALRDEAGAGGSGGGSEVFIDAVRDSEPDLTFLRTAYGEEYGQGTHVYFKHLKRVYIKLDAFNWIWWDVNLLTDAEFVFTIESTPADATVVINGVERKSIKAPVGTPIEWTVSRLDYHTLSGSTVMGSEDHTEKVALTLDLSKTELLFTVKTTEPNTAIPTILLRTTLISGTAQINYGDGNEEFLAIPVYQGDTEWTDSQGNTHFIDNGNAFRHTYTQAGTYQIRVRAGSAVNYFRLNDSLVQDPSGYVWPADNPYLIEVSKIQSSTLQNLDFSFGGLVNAVVATDFILDTPEVETMTLTFYNFGRNNLTHRWSFPAGMLSKITKPTVLGGTFFKCGLRKVEAGFLDSFVNLSSVWELFKNSMLGAGYYQDVNPWGPYPNSAISGDDDFIPVSLFWKNKFLVNISHAFNFIGDTGYGGLQSGYSSFLVLRRELFWNGKSVGNEHGTIKEAYYAFGKCNRILFEPNLFKHLPMIERMGGMFTQTNYMTHAVAWATMIPMAASETTFVTGADENGVTTATGKGLTFDLNLIFPDASYPSVTCMNGAFTCAADGVDYGFNRPIDYRPANLQITMSQAFNGADFLAKFPNAKADSVDARDLMFLGQTAGTETEKKDGRHGVFHRLNQADERIKDAATLPSLLFNNAVAY